MNTKNVLLLGTLVILVIFISGCATQKMYYWENYSKSLYDYKKDPSDKTLAEHKQVLLNIIQLSQENNVRVPPGVCCEYAYILIKEEKNDEAMKYLAMEEQAYPESRPFIARLKNKIEVQKK